MSQTSSFRLPVAVIAALILLCWVGSASAASPTAEEASGWTGQALGHAVVDDGRATTRGFGVDSQGSAFVASATEMVEVDRVRDVIDGCAGPSRHLAGMYQVVFVDDSPAGGERWVDGMLGDDIGLEPHRSKPVVRLALDVGTGEWSYRLGGSWAGDEKLRRHFDELLVMNRVDPQPDSVVEDVCRLVDVFEDFIEESGGDAEGFFLARQAERTADLVRRKLTTSLGDIRRHSDFPMPQGSRLYREDFEPLYEEARDEVRRTRDLLSQYRYREASEVAEQAGETADEVREVVDTVEEARDGYYELKQRADDIWIRRQIFVPHGRTVGAKYRECNDGLDRLEHRLDEAVSYAGIGSEHRGVEVCFDELDELLAETERSFWIWGVAAPAGGLVVVVFSLGLIIVRRRREMLQVEADAGELINEWGRRVPELVDDAEALAREHPEVFRREPEELELGEEALETIDHAFVLAARADEKLREAERVYDDLQRSDEEKADEIRAILVEGETTLIPEHCGGATKLQEQLRQPYTHANAELLDDLRELIEEARRIVGEAGR